MDGRNPNTPEHVDGMRYPDYIISKGFNRPKRARHVTVIISPDLEGREKKVIVTNHEKSKKSLTSYPKLAIKKILKGLKKTRNKITDLFEK